MVFLENYDVATARCMVQGCDIWLNTPLRPLEASGTSGMKALANGVINVSTLDGWWDEAWSMGQASEGDIGWAIGGGEHYDDPYQQDQSEAEAPTNCWSMKSCRHFMIAVPTDCLANGSPL